MLNETSNRVRAAAVLLFLLGCSEQFARWCSIAGCAVGQLAPHSSGSPGRFNVRHGSAWTLGEDFKPFKFGEE